MTDLLFMSIWILLSSLIRQIENGGGDSDNESDEEGDENVTQPKGGGGEELGIQQVEFEPFEPITQVIKIAYSSLFTPTAWSLSLCLPENWPEEIGLCSHSIWLVCTAIVF